MQLKLSADEVAFRDEIRRFFTTEIPADVRAPFGADGGRRGVPEMRESLSRADRVLWGGRGNAGPASIVTQGATRTPIESTLNRSLTLETAPL